LTVLHATGFALVWHCLWFLVIDFFVSHLDWLSLFLESRPKMYLYSCHDSTLTAILLALGCYDDKWPPYAADVVIELYQDAEGKHWVNVRYCGKVRTGKLYRLYESAKIMYSECFSVT